MSHNKLLLPCGRSWLLKRPGRVFACRSSDLGSIDGWDRCNIFALGLISLSLRPYPLIMVLIPVPRNSGTNFKLECVNVTGSEYIIHFYCLGVEAGFCSDVVECLHVDPAT